MTEKHVGGPASPAIAELVCVVFFFFLQDEGGRAAMASSPHVTALCSLSCEPDSTLLWARWRMRARSHARTHCISSSAAQYARIETHTHTVRRRATETAQGPSRSHKGGVPSHSLYSVPPRQYALLTIDNIFWWLYNASKSLHYVHVSSSKLRIPAMPSIKI